MAIQVRLVSEDVQECVSALLGVAILISQLPDAQVSDQGRVLRGVVDAQIVRAQTPAYTCLHDFICSVGELRCLYCGEEFED